MKAFTIFLLNLIMFTVAKADTLLIPDNTVSFEVYNNKCHADGYQCTPKYFVDQVMAKPTPLFDSFMETLDLSNKEFINGAVKNIQNLLQQEMITVLQLEMLERLLSQLQAANLSRADQLLKEVKFIQLELQKEKQNGSTDEKFIVYFKTSLPISKFIKMKKSYLNIPYVEINYNLTPRYSSLKGLQSETVELVAGVCESARLTIDTDYPSWKIFSNASCGWTKSISQNATSFATAVNNNKGWLLVGALTLGAVMLANHYEVQFQF